jgi:hypothetical protein
MLQQVERPVTEPEPAWKTALTRANCVRLARAELKRRIAASEVAAVDVIVRCPWEAQSMSISDVLTSQRGWGRQRSRRLLTVVGVPENKAVGTLTARQRCELSRVLRERTGHHDD